MSAEALAIYDAHRKQQVEEGTFSETAILEGGSEIKGVFDDSLMVGSLDAANQPRQSSRIRFLVDQLPTFEPRVTKITIRSIEYTIQKGDEDANGIKTLWLV